MCYHFMFDNPESFDDPANVDLIAVICPTHHVAHDVLAPCPMCRRATDRQQPVAVGAPGGLFWPSDAEEGEIDWRCN